MAEARGRGGDDMLEIECAHCHTIRRFKITEEYTLYTDRDPVEITQILP